MIQPPANSLSSENPPAKDGANGTRKIYPSADLIQHTIRVWEPRFGRTVTEEEARQILENVVGAFRVLQSWGSKERQPTSELKNANNENG